MAIKFEKIKAGDLLYDYHSERAGNTTFRRWGNWGVKILAMTGPGLPAPEVTPSAGRFQNAPWPTQEGAVVQWNGNRPEWYSRCVLQKLRAKPGPRKDPLADMFENARKARAAAKPPTT